MNDGGPAFPESYVGSAAPHEGIGGGMSLRDWFAGQALMGLVEFHKVDLEAMKRSASMQAVVGLITQSAAVQAYTYADAMLKEGRRPRDYRPVAKESALAIRQLKGKTDGKT